MKALKILALASAIILPVNAEETKPVDNCSANISQLEGIVRAEGAAVHGGVATDIRTLIQKAKEAQSKGDTKGCLSATNKAMSLYKTATD